VAALMAGTGKAPPGYAEIERAVRLLELGEPGRWVAGKLQALDLPAAQEAVRLLRARERDAARRVLVAALEQMAGQPSGEAMTWFRVE
jgi:hypothetical protein